MGVCLWIVENEISGYYIIKFMHTHTYIYIYIYGGARGVMVIVGGYGHGDTSSNPGPD